MKRAYLKRLIAEFTGTALLVLVGTGSIVLNQETNIGLGTFGIAVSFGAIVCLMILLFGRISGAHINPAVTISLAFANEFPKREALPYLSAQLCGGIVASYLIHILYPVNEFLGGTYPSGSPWLSFLLEILLTFALVLAVFLSAIKWKLKGSVVALIIGIIVFLEAWLAGPVCGASMNPVRSFAPALVSGHLQHQWIYLVAPFLGGMLAWLVYRFSFEKGGYIFKRSRG